jgi:ABC-2 type transport system permease protein
MSLRSLLEKEVRWSRHNLLALLLLLLVLPAFLAGGSVVFQEVIPEDAPVGVVAENDQVSEESLALVQAGLSLFSDPVRLDTPDQALRQLQRERVYAVVQVPPNITDPDETNATFVLTIDGSVVVFREPSESVAFQARGALNRNLPADVGLVRKVVGGEPTLSEYLVPISLLALVMLFAFTYVPYNLATESRVLDRLRVETSLERVVAAKLVFFALLLLVPVLVFQGAAAYLGYATDALDPGAVAVILLTFVYLAAISITIMILTGFSNLGRFLNAVVLLGLLAFSGLAYPVGFFSPLRRAIVRAMPTHYSTIVVRSGMMKDVSTFGLFADMMLALVGFTLVTLAGLKLAAVYYRRTA